MLPPTASALWPPPHLCLLFEELCSWMQMSVWWKALPLWNDKTAEDLPRFSLFSKGGVASRVNQIEPDKLSHSFAADCCCAFQKLGAASCFPGKNCKCLQKKRSSASPRGASPSPFLSLSLMYTTDNTIHKEPFLSYLSSCFRYFCKLQGGRIINQRETRWQSASIVAKKTNETAHPGKRPGDPAAIATPRARQHAIHWISVTQPPMMHLGLARTR